MNFLAAAVAGVIAPALIIAFVSALNEIEEERKREQKERECDEKRKEGGGDAEKRRRGEAVRQILFNAYRGMKSRAPGLHNLTTCISRESVPREVARMALEMTWRDLAGRYNCKPIETALDLLDNMD